MEEDLFENLPSEIITNILSRLSIRTIAISKCVRKSWLDLLVSDEFVKLYLSTFAAALAVLKPEANSSRCAVFDLESEIDFQSSSNHHFKHRLTKFNFPHRVEIEGSVNGMLLLHKYDVNANALYVCNPLSREYIELRCPQEFFIPKGVAYGFGESRITGEYKVVRIRSSNCDSHVYTLGTGLWRRVEAPNVFFYDDFGMFGALVNGNLHCYRSLPVLRDCLCVCDDTSGMEFIIWMMKEYGDEKSWTKEYVIYLAPGDLDGYAYFIKVFNDGDILMVLDQERLSYYSKETETIHKMQVFDEKLRDTICSMLLTPNFLSLKRFPMENVISF